MDKREFEYKAYAALDAYKKGKKVITSCALSYNPERTTEPIFPLFQKWLDKILSHSKFGHFQRIDYSGVVVDGSHIHVLMRKPFIPMNILSSDWDNLLGYHGNCSASTVTNTPNSLSRLIPYIVNQGDHHKTYDTVYFESPYWGILHVKRKDKEKYDPSKTPKTKWNSKKYFPAPWMIKDKYGVDHFLTDAEYQKYQKDPENYIF